MFLRLNRGVHGGVHGVHGVHAPLAKIRSGGVHGVHGSIDVHPMHPRIGAKFGEREFFSRAPLTAGREA